MFTRDFAKEVLRGDKKLFKLKEVKFISVVKYDELAVKHLYKELVTLDHMSQYFPNKYPKGRQCDRDYMFNIANTLHEAVIKEIVEHALQQRHAVDGIKMQNEAVLINDHWAQEIQSLPIICHVSIHFDSEIKGANRYFQYRKRAEWCHSSSRSPRSPSKESRGPSTSWPTPSRRES